MLMILNMFLDLMLLFSDNFVRFMILTVAMATDVFSFLSEIEHYPSYLNDPRSSWEETVQRE